MGLKKTGRLVCALQPTQTARRARNVVERGEKGDFGVVGPKRTLHTGVQTREREERDCLDHLGQHKQARISLGSAISSLFYGV
jgi:hypothetical protein